MKHTASTVFQLRKLSAQFCEIESLKDFCDFMNLPMLALPHLLQNLKYNEFKIAKTQGFREIEDPVEPLKDFLRELNQCLQSVYFHYRTPASYGFMVVPDDDDDERNIKTNAQRHLNKPWMLNADFQDFFHAISKETVESIFLEKPFCFNDELAQTLSKITTNKGRLPMGSPTSPVLSNFASVNLDYDLLNFSKGYHFTFTRFADDLTFSSNTPIEYHHLLEIKSICLVHGFRFNPSKIHILSPSVPKFVTGLKVSDKVEVEEDFYPVLLKEIMKLKNVREIAYRTGSSDSELVKRFEQQIKGFLQFSKFVSGNEHPQHQEALKNYRISQEIPDSYEPISWMAFNYF
jgi:hypothetical protein